MKAIILGNCANQTATNEGVSIIIEADEKLLIDAGPGVVRQILRAGKRCSDFEHVFITHSHGDHTAGFPYLIWNYFYESLSGAKTPSEINIYTFADLAEGLLASLKVCYVIDRWPFKLNFHTVSPDDLTEFNIGNIVVKTVPVIHTAKTFGLRIDAANKVVSYSSDTIYCEAFAELAKGSDLLIHEGFATEELAALSQNVKHAIGKDAGLCASNSNSKKLLMVHFFPPYQNRLSEIIDEAKMYFNGEVSYAQELLTYDV